MSCRYPSFLLGVFVVLVAQAANASPFCTQVKNVRTCVYADAEQCNLRAGELNGVCVANPDELRSTIGSARYCLVNTDRASTCVYVDLASCEVDAGRNGDGACLANPAAN
jgi:hypothetical protein